MEKRVNIIYSCDEWHSYSSFRFICVCDNEHLKNILNIIQKSFDYAKNDMEKYICIDRDILLNDKDCV